MDLKEFGRLLKEERLRQGLEIADVMDKTKISRMNLVAIEEGNEQALPHPVYAKGFVKNYARFLGLDADKMGNTLAQIYVAEDESEGEDLTLANAGNLPSVRESRPQVVVIVAILTVMVLVGSALWLFQGGTRGPSSQEQNGHVPSAITDQPETETTVRTDPAIGEDPLEDREPEVEGEPGSLAFPSLAEELGSESPEDAALPELESQAVRDSEDAVDIAMEQETPVAMEPRDTESAVAQRPVLAPAGVEKTLEIRATENCWLSAQADDARPREAFLRPGERFVIVFENTLDLRLGNAGGVALYIDGEPWPLSARSGEVMALRFP